MKHVTYMLVLAILILALTFFSFLTKECPIGYQGFLCLAETDLCTPNPCLHGMCEKKSNGILCTCDPGYNGRFCENDINECDYLDTPCVHGICVDAVNNFICECDDGYYGRYCELNKDDCADSNCVKGLCVDEVNGYYCVCFPGYIGEFCNTDVDDCASSPCRNGAKCLDLVNDYECRCKPGYTGKQCEIDIDECLSMPCRNGGICKDLVNSFQCNCAKGFFGNVCENAIDGTCDPSLCQHDGYCTELETEKGVAVSWSNVTIAELKNLTIPALVKKDPSSYSNWTEKDPDHLALELLKQKSKLSDPFYCVCTSSWTGNFCERKKPPPPTEDPSLKDPFYKFLHQNGRGTDSRHLIG